MKSIQVERKKEKNKLKELKRKKMTGWTDGRMNGGKEVKRMTERQRLEERKENQKLKELQKEKDRG